MDLLRNLRLDSGSQQASVNGTVLDTHPTSNFNNQSLEDRESGYVSHSHAVGKFIFLRHCGSLTFRVSEIYAPSIDDSFRFTDSRSRGTRPMERVG